MIPKINIFNAIIIDGTPVFRPSNFTPTREDLTAGEFTTCTGRLVADRIGWKYADMTLEWDYLPETMFQKILSLNGSFEIQFDDADGNTQTEAAIRRSVDLTATRMAMDDGSAIWKDVKMGVTFINAHN